MPEIYDPLNLIELEPIALSAAERADWECDRATRCATRNEPYVDGPAPTGEHNPAPPRTASSVDAPDADAESIECTDAAAEHVLETHGWTRKHTWASGLVHGDSARWWRCDEFARPSRPSLRSSERSR